MTIIVTGGCGFIGSNFVLDSLRAGETNIVNLDALTYAGNPKNLESLSGDSRYSFVRGDIADFELVARELRTHRPRAIVHFAAESHVDRSIHGPEDFIQTNVVGTFRLLEAARGYWESLRSPARESFRFVHVSTDEVYGSLGPADRPFSETSPHAPNSPYAASKAGSDHLVRSYFHTYGFPTVTTNCSNNYGPYQFPEKLIPLVILNALSGRPLPIYGDGMNVRDWIYVGDHCEAVRRVLEKGRVGQTYNIGARAEMANLELVRIVCALLDEMSPSSQVRSYADLITFVKDRPGHDRRYAIDSGKIETELGWKPKETLQTGLRKTVRWYLENRQWVESVTSRDYLDWIDKNYGNRSRVV
jgi:dTDP-glucose 4,6-dehydratase